MSQTPNNNELRGEVIHDLASGALCLVVSVGLAGVHFSQAGRLHDDFGRDPGPALLPELLLLCLALSGAGLAIRGLLGLRRIGASSGPEAGSLRSLWPAAVAVLLMATFLPLRNVVGAAIALMFVGASLAVLAGRTDSARWPLSAVLGGAIGLAFYALFLFGLSVPL